MLSSVVQRARHTGDEVWDPLPPGSRASGRHRHAHSCARAAVLATPLTDAVKRLSRLPHGTASFVRDAPQHSFPDRAAQGVAGNRPGCNEKHRSRRPSVRVTRRPFCGAGRGRATQKGRGVHSWVLPSEGLTAESPRHDGGPAPEQGLLRPREMHRRGQVEAGGCRSTPPAASIYAAAQGFCSAPRPPPHAPSCCPSRATTIPRRRRTASSSRRRGC